jgi:uncharacterized protein
MEFSEAKNYIVERLKRDLSPHLTYHSFEHVMDVYGCAENIAKTEGVDGEELELLLTAVPFHDSGFLVNGEDHENISCDMARQVLPEFGYSQDQVERICSMIMATQIPQSPKNQLEEILCDADLDYLGRDDFFSNGNKLFHELLHFGVVKNEEQWNRLQLKFLEDHHYFTKTAIELRKAKKEKHLQQVKAKVEEVKKG